MSFSSVHNCIRNKFSEIIDASSLIDIDQVAWDNARFRDREVGDDEPWVSFHVLDGGSEQNGLGSVDIRATGIALATVFVPIDRGDKIALELADEIKDGFFSTVHTYAGTRVLFRTPSVLTIGRDGIWWQVNVSCPYLTEDA